MYLERTQEIERWDPLEVEVFRCRFSVYSTRIFAHMGSNLEASSERIRTNGDLKSETASPRRIRRIDPPKPEYIGSNPRRKASLWRCTV
jgi:hypothetical protein